jgi:hypothetical protein
MKKLNHKPINFGKLQAENNILNASEEIRKLARLQNKEMFRDVAPHNKTIRRLPVTGKSQRKYIEQLFYHAGAFYTQNVRVAVTKHKDCAEQNLYTRLKIATRSDRNLIMAKLAAL